MRPRWKDGSHAGVENCSAEHRRATHGLRERIATTTNPLALTLDASSSREHERSPVRGDTAVSAGADAGSHDRRRAYNFALAILPYGNAPYVNFPPLGISCSACTACARGFLAAITAGPHRTPSRSSPIMPRKSARQALSQALGGTHRSQAVPAAENRNVSIVRASIAHAQSMGRHEAGMGGGWHPTLRWIAVHMGTISTQKGGRRRAECR
jgi:hypothetical protein